VDLNVRRLTRWISFNISLTSPAMNNRLPDHETEADWVKNMEEVEIVNYDPRWPVLFD